MVGIVEDEARGLVDRRGAGPVVGSGWAPAWMARVENPGLPVIVVSSCRTCRLADVSGPTGKDKPARQPKSRPAGKRISGFCGGDGKNRPERDRSCPRPAPCRARAGPRRRRSARVVDPDQLQMPDPVQFSAQLETDRMVTGRQGELS